MSDIAIRVENLSKQYHIGGRQEPYRTLRDTLADAATAPFHRFRSVVRGRSANTGNDTIWALKDVFFEVERGEIVGIIGRNGAGKTTLLKILSRITKPTTGHAEIYGRVGSLLEVGTGFHPELTGRENIYLNGAILGMTKAEIDRKFDEIVDFSGVEKFIDTPVKRYSSGMRVRLAFSVAAHLEPEILLVDEVLAVGDVGFQKKCVGKMENVAGEGRTVLFVSHNMASISALCPTCIYLEEGRIKTIGSTDGVIRRYLADFEGGNQTVLAERTDRNGDGRVRVTGLRFLDANTHHALDTVLSGQDVVIEVSYEAQEMSRDSLDRFNIGLAFFNKVGQFVMVLNSQMANQAFDSLPSNGRVYCHIPRFPLMAGAFHITVTLRVNRVLVDQVEGAVTIDVETGDFFKTGIPNAFGRQGVYVLHRWSKVLSDDAAFT